MQNYETGPEGNGWGDEWNKWRGLRGAYFQLKVSHRDERRSIWNVSIIFNNLCGDYTYRGELLIAINVSSCMYLCESINLWESLERWIRAQKNKTITIQLRMAGW